MQFDAGSFKDPAGRVFYEKQKIYRLVSSAYKDSTLKLLEAKSIKELQKLGLLIPTKISSLHKKEENIVLEHELIPFYSYPWEWSFHMLKDAALCTLNVMQKLLEDELILKDGTSFNVTFHKGRMVFVDWLSIEEYKSGAFWNGYNQFCQEFLYPLMLYTYTNMPHHILCRGSLTGISLEQTFNLLGGKKYYHPKILKYITLPYLLTKKSVRQNIKVKGQIKLPKSYLVNLINNLIQYISTLELRTTKTEWLDYENNNSYNENSHKQKREIIAQFVEILNPTALVDLGANTGEYSLIIQDKVSRIISVDIDERCIDRLYQKIKGTDTNIYPVVQNLMNISADCGWFLNERRSLLKRLNADCFQALALIHHLCIANNIPLESFVEFLKQVGPAGGIIEWVDKTDPMVVHLLRNRDDIFDHYTWENFLVILEKHFVVKKVETIKETRKLCLVIRKN